MAPEVPGHGRRCVPIPSGSQPGWLACGGIVYKLMPDLAGRLANRMQLTTDGHKAYLEAVEGAFGADIDYAMLVK